MCPGLNKWDIKFAHPWYPEINLVHENPFCSQRLYCLFPLFSYKCNFLLLLSTHHDEGGKFRWTWCVLKVISPRTEVMRFWYSTDYIYTQSQSMMSSKPTDVHCRSKEFSLRKCETWESVLPSGFDYILRRLLCFRIDVRNFRTTRWKCGMVNGWMTGRRRLIILLPVSYSFVRWVHQPSFSYRDEELIEYW